MPKTFKILKRYYSQIQVKKGLIFLQFVSLLIPAILSILTPVFSAKLITALTVFDYAGAKHFLWINFIIILASTAIYLAYNIVSIFCPKTNDQKPARISLSKRSSKQKSFIYFPFGFKRYRQTHSVQSRTALQNLFFHKISCLTFNYILLQLSYCNNSAWSQHNDLYLFKSL